jgi:ribosomal protein S27AE
LPERAWYEYRGKALELPYFDMAGGGYVHTCPKCGVRTVMSNHVVTFDPNGKVCVSPSIACVRGCDYHIWIEHGVARDA